MLHHHRPARRVVSCAAAFGTIAALTLAGVPRTAAQPLSPIEPGKDTSNGQRARKGDYDSRAGSAKQQLEAGQKVTARRAAAQSALNVELGTQGIQQIDSVTATPKMVGRLDGFLTKASKKKADVIVLAYVRAHLAAFGLTESDLDTFVLRRRYTDVAGIQHLSWIQRVNGVDVFGNGLKGNVTKHGELISIQGSPIANLAAQAAAAGPQPELDAAQARQKAATDVGGRVASAESRSAKAGQLVTWSNDDRAQLVWFATSRGVKLAWSTYVQAGGADLNYQHVVDARTGSVLYRHDTTDSDQDTTPGATTAGSSTTPSTSGSPSTATDATTSAVASSKGQALVFSNYPGAPKGGKQKVYDLVKHKMVAKSATSLSGYYVNAFADVNDDNVANAGETVAVPGSTGSKPQYKFVSFPTVNTLCRSTRLCTWNPSQPNSWTVNKAADVTQGFYYNSLYHNYLLAKPFGFTRAAGNFEQRDGDAVQLNALDGAATAGGLPDGNHIDNANMNTPPDGIAPTMQMYLFHYPGATNSQDGLLPTSSSFDPSVILHEYTHGLSNRLVVDATGNSTLNSVQAGSMGEAWSDYYAEDYLVTHKLETDTKTPGDVVTGKYVDAGQHLIRTMGIDCPVNTTSSRCTAPSGARGGYTYGDFSTIIGYPEVHASGEIWGQTLWDLRAQLGHSVTGMLATRAMELSPSDPSFLDMRNSILQADQAVYGGHYRAKIWSVFAKRGMGFYAASLRSQDTKPAQSFAKPPTKSTPKVTVKGRVRDGLSGRPLAHALVTISGHDSGFAGDYRAFTDATGLFKIAKVPTGTYPAIATYVSGYEIPSLRVKVTKSGATVFFNPRRDWAAASGGGEVASFTGPDFTPYGCGPDRAIDLSQGNGWGTTTGTDGSPTNTMIPKAVVVHLADAITLSSFAVDPSNTCGDDASSATGKYRIDTSPNGSTWTLAASGTFTKANVGRLNAVPVASPVANVSYVRFTMLSPQVPGFASNCPDGGYTGCQYTDMTELEVYGTS
ncbi:M36 family metallopeptidase [uncultured Friedmanniella sp.]|uniref:M36 family metallopeptidase n=1 Tax=uncultured Friedmanniella sp. TaxID=335381 RepID=UPI0035CAD017